MRSRIFSCALNENFIVKRYSAYSNMCYHFCPTICSGFFQLVVLPPQISRLVWTGTRSRPVTSSIGHESQGALVLLELVLQVTTPRALVSTVQGHSWAWLTIPPEVGWDPFQIVLWVAMVIIDIYKTQKLIFTALPQLLSIDHLQA